MRKKSQAQLKLERLEMIDSIVHCKLIEQRQMKELALSITANMDGERVQSSGTKSKLEDCVVKCIDMEEKIADAVDKLLKEKQEIVDTIEQLYNPMEYRVVHMRYIQYMELKDIADYFHKEYSWVTTTLGRAIAGVQRILDERTKGCGNCEGRSN